MPTSNDALDDQVCTDQPTVASRSSSSACSIGIVVVYLVVHVAGRDAHTQTSSSLSLEEQMENGRRIFYLLKLQSRSLRMNCMS